MTFETKAIVRRLASLKTIRQPVEKIWSECFDFTYPERGNGLDSQILSAQDAQTKKNRILDDTAPESGRILSANLVTGTTPANSIWFALDSGNDPEEGRNDEESRWLDDAARIIFENIHASNFDAAAFECCVDIVPAGWFVLYVDEAPEGGYNFEQWPLAQCYISSSKAGGLVDTIYREVELTVEQAVAKYGIDKVSDRVRSLYEQEKYDDTVKIVHAIQPRAVHVVGGRFAKNMPFASYHVELETNHPLLESGYPEFPCVVPRWLRIPGSAYATGPMSAALGATRTINDIAAMELMNLDMAAAGMYGAIDDGILNPKTVKIGPRKIIVMNDKNSFFPVAPAGRFDVVFSSRDQLQASIRKSLLADQLQPQDGPNMTAYEVNVRVQMIRQLLGPIYGRLQAEYLQPLITRCFGIAYRAGILGRPPESLLNRNFTIKYISPLARAQKLEEVNAIDQYINGAAAAAKVHPDILDTIDFDAAQRVRGKALGVPTAVMPEQKVIDAKRQARADAQQQQQQAAMQQEMLSKATPAIAQQMAA